MKRSLLIVLLLSLSILRGFSQDIYTYTDSVSGAPFYHDVNLAVYSNLTAIGTGTATACSYGFSGITGFTGGSYSTAGPCVEVTITAAAGYYINLTGWYAGLRRSTTGPDTAVMAYSTDGGTTWVTDGIRHNPFNGSCASPTSYPYDTVGAYQAVGTTNTTYKFRLYPYHGGGGGTFQVYYLDIIGSVVATCTPIVGSIAAAGATSFCPGNSVVLNATPSTGGYSYQWYNGALAIGAAVSASYTATTAGTYHAIISGTGFCNDTTNSVTVTVNPAPTASVSALGATTFCPGGSVVLSSSTGAGYSYQWYNGATPIAGATNSTYTATATGTYKVVVSNSFGCTTTSSTVGVTVTAVPTGVITPAGSTTLCSGASVLLSATVGAGYTYQWYNTGVAIGGATNTTYPASAAGSYTVIITVPGGCTDTTAAVPVTVNPVPTVSITASGPTTFCAPGTVTLTGPAGAGYTYQWRNGATAIAGATNMTYVANTTGTYNVTVTNSFGCSASAAAATSVTVNPLPSTTITAGGATSFCSGGSVVLSVPSAAGLTYQWAVGGTPIGGATNNTYTAIAPGSYSITVTNAVTGCSASSAASTTVTVNPLPPSAVSASGALNFCAGGSVVLSATAGAGYTYQWYNGATMIAGATNVAYTATATGNYTVHITNPFACSATSAVTAVTVNALPVATITASGPTTFCTGTLTLTATAVAGSTYQWNNGATAIAGATNNAYTTSTTGNFNVTITNAAGCSATSTNTVVTVLSLPYIIASGDTTFCSGSNVLLLLNISSAITGVAYQWKRDGAAIPGATTNSYTATASGVYTCFVNIPPACASTTTPITVNVLPSPTPVITFDGIHMHTQTGYVHYVWTLNTVHLVGDTTAVATVFNNGTYRVLVTDTNGCQAISAPFILGNLSVGNVNAPDQISIYPNPANNELHIDSKSDVFVTICSMDGKTVVSQTNEKVIATNQLVNGIYTIMMFDDKMNRIGVQKLVISH